VIEEKEEKGESREMEEYYGCIYDLYWYMYVKVCVCFMGVYVCVCDCVCIYILGLIGV